MNETANARKDNAVASSRTSGFASAGSCMFARASTIGGTGKAQAAAADDDDDDEESDEGVADGNKDDDSDDLADDPLTAKPRKAPAKAPAPAKRKPGRPPAKRQPSPLALSSDEGDSPAPSPPGLSSPIPSQSLTIPSIPRPLLLRLMHEHFASKTTKIDKHAIAILEKYFELFVREAIAKAALAKREDVAAGAASQSEERWLEKGDLEKVVAGLILDF